MIKKLLLPLFATVAIAAPAAAVTLVETQQTRNFTLGTLDDAAITAKLNNFASFNSFALVGQRLHSVKLDVTYAFNGQVSATNSTTGGTALSRRRQVSANYTLNGDTSGMGFTLSGTSAASQTATIGGQGTVRILAQLNPTFSLSQTLSSDLSGFYAGPVRLTSNASAVFASVANNNVSYGAPSIIGGSADLTLTYISTVPEAPVWGLLIAGFGLVGYASRRRSVTVAA